MKKFLVNYFFFVLFFLAFFSSGFVDSQDGFQYLAIARRFYFDHTFEMPLESFDTGENIHMSLVKNRDTKKIYSPTGLGYSLSLLPAVFLEDIFLKLSDTQPISAFPLQSDWPVLLFASMTNAFWGALFTVTLYLYFAEINLRHKTAVVLSFLFTVGTNIFVYTKHTFAQMMFVSLMTLSFYFLKKFFNQKTKLYLFFSGVALGGVVISYNPTFLFTLPAFVVYYLFLKGFKINFKYFKTTVADAVLFLLGFAPFFFLYKYFNSLRLGGTGATSYGDGSLSLPGFPPTYVILEGIWGLLLSPGKSIFIYSPILLVLILFWFKIKKKIIAELVTALVLFLIYLWFIGTLLGGPDYLVWHGDSSWGPRYLLPVLPLFFVVIAYIYKKLTYLQKLLIFYPLLIFGIFVNSLSVFLPYQIRFAGLQTDAFINERNFNVYEYGNELPRYMPVFKMSKTLVKRIKKIPKTFNHGEYNLKLLDGFDYPFDLGWTTWRALQPVSYFSFDEKDHNIETISLQIRNHLIDNESTQSALLATKLNGVLLSSDQTIIKPDSEKEIIFNLGKIELLEKNNVFSIESSFESSTAAELKKKQVLFLENIKFNSELQNIETIDYPYYSPISKNLYNLEYYYWGNAQKDPWSIWHMHSGVYEQTFDLWWLRPFHYWDMPKEFFSLLLIVDVFGIIYFGSIVLRHERKK